MNTPSHLIIAIIAGLVNLVLSLVLPCLLKQSDQPMIQDIKNIYQQNKKSIVVSTIIIVVTVYLALSVVDELYSRNNGRMSIMDEVSSDFNDMMGLSNLSKLNSRSFDELRELRELFATDTMSSPSLSLFKL